MPDSFVGREAAVAELEARLRSGERVLCLVGPGGIGKTRLAHHLAAHLADEDLGDRWFVDAAAATDVDGLGHALAGALGLTLAGGDAVAQLGLALARKGPCLVVLDNLEQAVEPAAEALARWTRAAPEVRWLLTSRAVLGVRGERVIPVEPLDLAAGVQLFRDRSGIEVDPSAVVAAVEGHALSIELAAARTRILPVPAIAKGLNDALGLLRARHPDRPARHASLEAVLDGSWALASEKDRRALVALSAFQAGFDLDGAVALLGEEALDRLQALVDQSLLRSEPASGRFRLLVLIRQYAHRRADPAELEVARERLARWLARLGTDERLRARHGDPTGSEAQAAAGWLDDLVASVRWALARGTPELALPLARVAWQLMRARGPMGAAADLLLEVHAAVPVPTRSLLHDTAQALTYAGRGREALGLQAAMLAEAERTGDARHQVVALLGRSRVFADLGELDRAREEAGAALAAAERAGDGYHRATAHLLLAQLARRQGDRAEAIAHTERGCALLNALEGWDMGAMVRAASALALADADRYAEALVALDAATEAFVERGDRWRLMEMYGLRATFLDALGRPEEALAEQLRALDLARELGSLSTEAETLVKLAARARASGDEAGARTCLLEARELFAALGHPAGLEEVDAALRV